LSKGQSNAWMMAMPMRFDLGMRRLLTQAGIGVLVSWAVLAGLLITDAADLATLIIGSDVGGVALALLTLQFGGGFATFAVATSLALPTGGNPRGRAVDAPPVRRAGARAYAAAVSRPRRQ
jgi:hypothetical protein